MSLPAPLQSLLASQESLAHTLAEWSSVNSGSHHIAGLRRMHRVLADAFSTLPDVVVSEIPGHASEASLLSVRCRPEAPIQLLLSGHYDTVFGADHPFQTPFRKDAETLVGPGVSDMKGGLLVMLSALKAFEETEGKERVGWEALITPDEEIGSTASAPSLLAAAARNDFGLVFEPARASGDLVRSRKGSGNFKVTCHGRAAHAGQVPNNGRNAIAALAGFLVSAHQIPASLPSVLLNIGRISGGGPLNVVPDFAQAELNIRTTYRTDGPAVLKRLSELALDVNGREGFRLEIEGAFDCEPKESGPVEEQMFAAWQACRASLGLAPFDWIHTGGASDGNLLCSAGLPSLDGVGPIGGALHTDEEYCLVSSLSERATLAALFLHRVALGEITLPRRQR